MKTKLFIALVAAGIALTGCSSTQNTTSNSDSDSIATMMDTISRDTMRVDTPVRDTTKRDTSKPQ